MSNTFFPYNLKIFIQAKEFHSEYPLDSTINISWHLLYHVSVYSLLNLYLDPLIFVTYQSKLQYTSS